MYTCTLTNLTAFSFPGQLQSANTRNKLRIFPRQRNQGNINIVITARLLNTEVAFKCHVHQHIFS